MNITEFNILNSLYNASLGRAQTSFDIETRKAVKDKKSHAKLVKEGLIDKNNGSITKKGIDS